MPLRARGWHAVFGLLVIRMEVSTVSAASECVGVLLREPSAQDYPPLRKWYR